MVDRDDEAYCFRLHKDRVYYVSESSMRLAISVARHNLITLGTCFGKFSKSGKFKLHVTALDYLAQYAKHKVRLSTVSQGSSYSSFSGLGQAERRNAVFIWEPRPKSSPGTDNGGHSRKSRCGCSQHEGYSSRMYLGLFFPILLVDYSQGFGVTARSTVGTRKLDPTAILVYHQAYAYFIIHVTTH